jgi:adenylate cyclase
MSEAAHILVVDDDASIRRLLELLLSDTGYRVTTVSSGEEALAYLELVTPDLILMDLMLPGMNGQETTRRIKHLADRPFIPVILVTARGDQQSKVKGLDAGADDFLVKPLDFAELLARVRAMLRLQRSQRSLQTEQRKTELLLHLTRELGTTLDLDELLMHFLDRLADAVGAVRASIILPSGELPLFYSNSRFTPRLPLETLLQRGVAGWVFRERQATIIVDVLNDPRWLPTEGQDEVRSVAAVPIMREGRVRGAITLVHHTPGYFNEQHIDLLNSAAAQSAIALENAELFRLTSHQNQLLARRTEELQQINEVSRHMTELMRPDQLIRLVSHLIHHTFGYQTVSVLLREGQELVLSAVVGDTHHEVSASRRLAMGQGIAGCCALEQRAINVPNAEQDERYVPLHADEHALSVLAVPIFAARTLFGVLDVRSEQANAFGPNDVQLLTTLATQLGVALENARLYQQIETERSMLDAVLHGAADPILLISPDNRLLLANQAATTRLQSGEAVGQPISMAVKNPDALAMLTAPADEHRIDTPNELVLPNGDTFNVRIAPVRSTRDEPIGRVAVLQDITAIKELERQRQERLRSVFQRYVSPQVVEQVLAGGGDIGAPVERDVVVLFADLRGYTSLTEGMDPHKLVNKVLNRYFDAMTEVLYRYEGTIDKFLGDGIIGVFGIPIAHDDDLPRSLAAAVDMQRAFYALQQDWQRELHLNIGMGIGISYGNAVVGNIGSAQRLDYTLIGDVVNTASRLNGIAEAGQIVVSYHLVDELTRQHATIWSLRPIGKVNLKGKAEPHLVYETVYSQASHTPTLDMTALREVGMRTENNLGRSHHP